MNTVGLSGAGFLAVLSFLSSQLLAQNVNIQGVVLDGQNRIAVTGARVSATGEQATRDAVTDSEGHFRLPLQERIKPGDPVRIHVSKEGYEEYDTQKPASSETILTILLLPVRRTAAGVSKSASIEVLPLISKLEPDKPRTLNYKIRNAGDIKAEQVTLFIQARMIRAPVSGKAEDELFETIRDQASASSYGDYVLDPGQERIAAEQVQAISSYWFENIKAEKNAFIVAGLFKYRAAHHSRETDFCWVYSGRQMQIPRKCRAHNQIKDRQDNENELGERPNGPTFTEDVQEIVLDFGRNSIIWNLPQSNRQFAFDSGFPITLYYENKRLYVDADVYYQPQGPPLRIRRNHIPSLPLNWDSNSNDKALEIVDENFNPIFQIFYRRSYRVAIMGLFPIPIGVVSADYSGIGVFPPGEPIPHTLRRLFRYPSWKYSGQFEESASEPQ